MLFRLSKHCVLLLLMRTTSYTELRKNLASALEKVVKDREPVIITRQRGKPVAVLMSIEEFTSWEETLHLLRSPTNAARLRVAVGEFDKAGGTECKLVE